MKQDTEETIRRAWTELLGTEALTADGARIHRIDDSAATISFVRVLGQGVLSGPRWAVERAANLGDDELARLSVLLRLAADHDARPLGAAELSYTDARVDHAALPMTQEDAALEALEAACSDEDIDEVGLSGMPHHWVILDSADPQEPLAGSGYVVWADSLAHMGVLTSPRARGRGYGVLAAAVGTDAALDAGLIPQWRVRWDNEASKRVAQVLGYELAGSQTTVLIDSEA